ncbi:MAG: hypothetical protein R8G34_08405 [Paracoccaceae bacterium]|nr:hypothetical protein [Paracoccaceae bacterium]
MVRGLKQGQANEPIGLIGIEGGRSGGGGIGSGSGGGGGGEIDRAYVDARIEAVKAQNETAYARLEAKIDSIQPGATWQQNAGLLGIGIVGALGLIFAILSWGSDRFDSGVSAMGAVEEALDTQRELNVAQDARLEKILEALEAQSGEPETGPEGQD